jgi:hypothetical protein
MTELDNNTASGCFVFQKALLGHGYFLSLKLASHGFSIKYLFIRARDVKLPGPLATGRPIECGVIKKLGHCEPDASHGDERHLSPAISVSSGPSTPQLQGSLWPVMTPARSLPVGLSVKQIKVFFGPGDYV